MDSFLKKIVWAIILLPAIYLAAIWQRLPARVVVHLNLQGHADRLGSKSELLTAVIVLTITNAVVYLLVTNIYRIDPKRYAAENKQRLQRIAFAVVLFISVILCLIIYAGYSGAIHFRVGLILAATGLLFAVIGNYLPNLKPNYFAGIRLPWTLENEDNWKKTHALAGKMWFAGGLMVAIACLILSPEAGLIVFFAVMTVIVLVPCIYSYRLFKQRKKNSTL